MTSPYTALSFQDAVPLESLLRHLMPIVPEVPHGMALDRIRQAYIEFARRSSIIVAKLGIDYQADVHDYPLIAPEGYEVHMVMGIESPGYSFVDYWAGYNRGLWGTKFDVIDNSSIYLHNSPSVDNMGGLQIYCQLLPNNCCEVIPISIDVPYGKGIVDGAIKDLLRIPNKPWTSPGLAKQADLDFNRTIMAARNLADTNRQRGPVRPYRRRVV